jgi:hypothetical protein
MVKRPRRAPKGAPARPPEQTVAAPADRARIALTLRITVDLHERLRAKAFHERTTIQDIIVGRLKDI